MPVPNGLLPCLGAKTIIYIRMIYRDKALAFTHHRDLRGVVASGRISQDFVPFLIDAGLVPSSECASQKTIEVFIHRQPLAYRRKRNAPHLEGVVKPATPANFEDLLVPAVFLEMMSDVYESPHPDAPAPRATRNS